MVMAPRGNAHGLVEWSRRDPWRERMGEIVERHIRRACDLNDIDIYDLQGVIGEHRDVSTTLRQWRLNFKLGFTPFALVG
ncbi:hypothetical protein [Loktanella fryxellensis]|uniref:hypothetical protein n=1 Tax=Loktanella fryxellensis TaxID=245187 RepID=UPI00115F790E|nr:hypothetical protein [Loktanella fryxellensis]